MHRNGIAGMAAIVCVSALGLAGCGSDSSGASSDKNCEPIAKVKTIHEGELTAWSGDFPPFIVEENGKLSGPDGVLLERVAEKLCLKLRPEVVQFAAAIEGLRSGKADISSNEWTLDEKRAEMFEVSEPFYSMGGALISTKAITSIDELKGLRVGTPQGYQWNDDFQKVLGEKAIKLYQTEQAVFADLEAGRLDVGIFDQGSGDTLLSHSKNNDLRASPLPKDERISFTRTPPVAVVLIQKGNTELKKAVDLVLAEYRSSGDLAKELEKVGVDPEFANPAPR